jgi:hypothetical protein
MTFGEWCDQTTRETKSNIPRALVKEVLLTALRVGVEELMSNPAEADLDIKGIGRFYLHRRLFKIPKNEINPNGADHVYRWVLQFKCAKMLREIICGRRPLEDLTIAKVLPLYPEYKQYYGARTPFGQKEGKRYIVKRAKRKRKQYKNRKDLALEAVQNADQEK